MHLRTSLTWMLNCHIRLSALLWEGLIVCIRLSKGMHRPSSRNLGERLEGSIEIHYYYKSDLDVNEDIRIHLKRKERRNQKEKAKVSSHLIWPIRIREIITMSLSWS